MAFLDQYTLSVDATFKNRVQAAIVKASIVITNEPVSGISSTRVALAVKVLSDPAGWAARFAAGLATDSPIAAKAPTQANVTDVEIDAAVAGQWNSFAHV